MLCLLGKVLKGSVTLQRERLSSWERKAVPAHLDSLPQVPALKLREESQGELVVRRTLRTKETRTSRRERERERGKKERLKIPQTIDFLRNRHTHTHTHTHPDTLKNCLFNHFFKYFLPV